MVDPIIFIIITLLAVSLGIKVTSTQNPVYSGLYLVLLFFLGSGIAFLLGLEFMALLFLLVYAGAIAVLVLFVVMMLDVKAIENPWSADKKKLLYLGFVIFLSCLVMVAFNDNLQVSIKYFVTACICSLAFFTSSSYEVYMKKFFQSVSPVEKELYLSGSGELPDFFQLFYKKEGVESSYGLNKMWFLEFDSSCALNDPSYLLYTTYAILLIIAGVILLIAMIGAISLTLQKNCPESLYRQLGRESNNAIFLIKEKASPQPKLIDNSDVSY